MFGALDLIDHFYQSHLRASDITLTAVVIRAVCSRVACDAMTQG